MKSLLSLLLLLSTNFVIGQKINGIDSLTIGKMENEILDILKIQSKDIIDGSTKTAKYINTNQVNTVFRIRYDPTSDLIKELSSNARLGLDFELDKLFIEKCNNSVVYFIPEYQTKGILMKNLVLTFYNNMLIRILYKNDNNENSDFMTFFENENGSGTKTVTRDIDDYGDSSVSTSVTWLSKTPNVSVESWDFSFSDNAASGAKQLHTYRFRIENAFLVSQLNKCNQSAAR